MINLMEVFMKTKDEIKEYEVIIYGIFNSLYKITFEMTFNSNEIQ